jgi:uracil permease
MTSLAATVSVFLFARGTLKLIPILCGLGSGYLVSVAFSVLDFFGVLDFSVLDFSVVADAPWIAFPGFVIPEFKFDAILFLVPAAVVPIIVHFGDILAIGEVTENDFLKDPGVHRTLLGNGVATTFAACIGGPPVRVYAEVTGTVAILKRFEPALMVWAALFAILLSFFGKLGALLQTINQLSKKDPDGVDRS